MKAAQVMQDIGRRIAELREGRGITQEKLAERARVDARTIQRAEAGRHLTLALLICLADVFGVHMTTLFEVPNSRAVRRAGRPAASRSMPAAAEREPRTPKRRPRKRSRS